MVRAVYPPHAVNRSLFHRFQRDFLLAIPGVFRARMARVQSVPKFFHRISKTSASCALTSPLGVHTMPALFFLLFVAFLLGILIGWLMRRRPSGDGRDIRSEEHTSEL